MIKRQRITGILFTLCTLDAMAGAVLMLSMHQWLAASFFVGLTLFGGYGACLSFAIIDTIREIRQGEREAR